MSGFPKEIVFAVMMLYKSTKAMVTHLMVTQISLTLSLESCKKIHQHHIYL